MSAPPPHRHIRRARETLGEAETVVVLTGAGVSADSGVPTFRGQGGLWREHRPEDLATPAAFARDPRLVWEWYGWRRELVSACAPNAAHLALARWQEGPRPIHIVTQNVDGLHRLARDRIRDGAGGSTTGEILELHGSLFRTRCTCCAAVEDSRAPIDATSEASLPHCGACGALLRPDVVWFGEPLDAHVLDRAFRLAARAEVCLVVGTSAIVQPAAAVATEAARAGAALVEVNPEVTPLLRVAQLSLRGRAAEIVPLLV